MTLQDFIGEEALLRTLNIKRSTLDGLRQKGLPFINLGLNLNRASRGESNPTP
jgi:hypothetical protein